MAIVGDMRLAGLAGPGAEARADPASCTGWAGIRNSAAAMPNGRPALAGDFPDQQSGIAVSPADGGGASGDGKAPRTPGNSRPI
jgi:hypothetical protein